MNTRDKDYRAAVTVWMMFICILALMETTGCDDDVEKKATDASSGGDARSEDAGTTDLSNGPMVDQSDATAEAGAGTSGASGADSESGTGGSSGTSADMDAGVSTSPDGASLPHPAEPVIPSITGECPVFENGTINYMGLDGILLEVGTRASEPTAPLLFYWHMDVSAAVEYIMMASNVVGGIISQGGVVVAFNNSSGEGDCSCSGTGIFCMSDMDIVDQLVACAIRDHNVDPRRIFTTGCGEGGLFATCLAVYRSSYIAAVAPNSGGWIYSYGIQDASDSDFTPAIMTMNGAEDLDVMGISFPQTSAMADQAFKSEGGFVISCNHGGIHCGGTVLSRQVWEFFQVHPYGVDSYPWTEGLPNSFRDYCTIF